jgi:transglutaminase-like putative cysteine protease
MSAREQALGKLAQGAPVRGGAIGRNASSRVDEPLLAAFLRPLVYMIAGFALAYPLATRGVAVSVAACAFAGALVGRGLARSRLRGWTIALFGGGALALSVLLRGVARDARGLPAMLGPAAALSAIDATFVGLSALCASAVLRALCLRVKLLAALEVAAVGVAFAQLVAGHRGGAINRPFGLADSIIAQGGDPSVALLGIGVVATLVSVVLLLRERSLLRALFHGVLALLLAFLLFTAAREVGLPEVKPATPGLGLQPKKPRKDDHAQGQGKAGQNERTDNEQLEFRDDYGSEGRQVPLAVVLLHDDYSPPGGLYYFRQAAFSQYNGRRLVGATRGDVDRDLVPGFVHDTVRMPEVPNELGKRSMLDTTVAMLADHNRPFALESPVELKPENNPDPGRFRRAYRATSAALDSAYEELVGLGVGDPTWSPEQWAHYLEGPKDPRYGKLASEITDKMPPWSQHDAVAEAMAVVLWLGREGTYSLKSGHAQAADPTADFLFGDRTGYCVHFAHAAVYLMRALGVPARVGAGYAVEEAARQGGSALLLSGANSHAWPEVYVTGVGWVVLDVSPARSLDPPVSPPDSDLQRLLGEMARGEAPLPQGDQRLLEPAIAALRGLPMKIARALAVLIPALLLLGYAVKLWRRLAPRLASDVQAPRVVYRAQLDRLSDVALRRGYGESREAFATRVAQASPSFRALTALHVAARFGREQATDRSALRALDRKVVSELTTHVPPRRRWLGSLRPFSWLASR